MSSAADQITKGPAVPPTASSPRPEEAPAKKPLGLWDAVSIIVGIVVGAGIYQTSPTILWMTGSSWIALVAWAVGGVVSFFGALCYAELASAYPRAGGDIVYLNRAFGRWCGFLFGWVQLTVILTGSIGAMAFVFANYSIRLFQDQFGITLGTYTAFAFAGGAILLLTLTNIIGVVVGKTVQNVLTVAKIIGLTAIIVAGFMVPTPGAFAPPENIDFFPPMIGVALVLILYTYGGWNDAAFVAAEVQDGKKNITRSLVIGILVITLLYMLVNVAYISSLGFAGAMGSRQIAADVLNRGFGKGGVTLMCVLVMVSSLGAVNGLIFTGARVYATIGKDYAILGWMGSWSRGENGAPVPALLSQGVLAMALVFLVGTDAGRNGINWLLDQTALRTAERPVLLDDGSEGMVEAPAGHVLSPIAWDSTPAKIFQGLAAPADTEKKKQFDELIEGWKKKGAFPEHAEPLAAALVEKGFISREKADELLKSLQAGAATTNLASSGFETLVTCTAPIFWLFFLLTGLALFALRERDRDIERPFRVPLYPTLPLLFCLACAYVLYSSLAYAFNTKQWGGGVFLLAFLPLAVGLPLYHLSELIGNGRAENGTETNG
jgi:amino acid transporter